MSGDPPFNFHSVSNIQVIIAKKTLNRSLRFFFPPFAWLVFSTILLTLPGEAFPQQNWLSWIWFDKWVHIGMFGIMALLLCRGVYKKNATVEKLKQYFIVSGILCLGYGIVMEFIQKYYVPNRSFDVGDIIADGVGSLLGVLVSLRLYKKNRPL